MRGRGKKRKETLANQSDMQVSFGWRERFSIGPKVSTLWRMVRCREAYSHDRVGLRLKSLKALPCLRLATSRRRVSV
jgi:hypothetical protein